MDGHVVHSPWVVREAEGSGSGATGQAASGDVSGNVPEGGVSSWNDWTDPSPPPGLSDEPCRVTIDALDDSEDVEVSSNWGESCTTGKLLASVTGPPTTIASSDDLAGDLHDLHATIWPCRLAGGSDMPGTVVHFEATGSASGSADHTLPDHGDLLDALIVGTPDEGTKVEPGDQIYIESLARVEAPALGVKTLYVDDGNDLLESVGNRSGSDQPVKCDPRRFYAGLKTTYTVPNDPPPMIELCATGVGFDGTKAKDCIRYYTGDVWEGKAAVSSYVNYPEGSATCKDSWAVKFAFSGERRGNHRGTGDGGADLWAYLHVPGRSGRSARRVPGQGREDHRRVLGSIRTWNLAAGERRGLLWRRGCDVVGLSGMLGAGRGDGVW